MHHKQNRSEFSQAALRVADIRDNDLITDSYFSALRLPHHVCRKLLVCRTTQILGVALSLGASFGNSL